MRHRQWPGVGPAPILALALFLLLFIANPSQAWAVHAESKGQGQASLSDITVEQGQVATVLTVPAEGDTVRIDADTLQVRLGDQAVTHVAVRPVERERRAAILLIDTSGSMGEEGIAAATAAAEAFLRQVPSDVSVGLATFSDSVHVLRRPTRDRASLRHALNGLKAKGETALYDGVAASVQELDGDGGRSLLLLSDGGDTVSNRSLARATAAVKAAHVRLDAVAFRTDESDNSALQALARAGQGRVIKADDDRSLTKAFASVASALAGQVQLSFAAPPRSGGTQDLTVTGKANGQAFRARADVTLPKPPAESEPEPSASSSAPPSTPAATAVSPGTSAEVPPTARSSSTAWRVLAASAVFIGLFALGLVLASPLFMRTSKRRIRSMDRYLATSVQARAKQVTSHGSSAVAEGALKVADAWAKGRASSARTALLLERADLLLRLNEWYVLRLVAVVVSIALFWLWWYGSLLTLMAAVLVGTVVGLVLPVVYLKVKAGMRARKFESQLPDVLTLVASSLSTGFSLAQSVDAITRDAAEPSAKEFSRALAETRIGSEIEDSLDRLAVRMDSTNLKWTVMAIRIQRQVGGNLAETLRTTAATLRDRESLKRQVKALSAEGKLSAYILIALPFGLFGYMMMVNRDYISLLWSSLLGLGMLAFGAVSIVIGILWMRKVVVVEV